MKKTSNSTKQITLCLMTAAAAVALSGCDSKHENAAEKKADRMEEKADNVRKAGEQKADAIESKKSSSNDHATNERLEKKADATRDAAEHKADAIEEKADAVRDQSPSPTP
jgi:type IV pilus biogenesis protein CpaD/CtpE